MFIPKTEYFAVGRLALMAAVAFGWRPVLAQQPGASAPPVLFLCVDTSGWQDSAATDEPATLRARPVDVDFALLASLNPEELSGASSSAVQFNLFDDVSASVVFTEARARFSTAQNEPVGYTWLGDVISGDGGQVVMVTDGATCIADIHLTGGGWYHVRDLGGGHVVREVDGGASLACGAFADSAASPAEDAAGPQGAPAGDGPSGPGPSNPGACDDGDKIDLVVVWTPHARELAAQNQGGDPTNPTYVRAKIDLAVADANRAYANSQVVARLRLVAKTEIAFDDTAGSVCDHKDALAGMWDGAMDDVHALRDTMRGDLVCLLTGTGGCCPAPLGCASGVANVMNAESPLFEKDAFSVVLQSVATAPAYVLAHETGHNMGCAHNRAQYACPDPCTCQQGAFTYSFGYNFPPGLNVQYFTIMAIATGPGQTRVPYFSNPDVLYHTYPTGVAPPSCDSADNALTLNETRDTVARFRTVDVANTTRLASADASAGQGNGDSSAAAISEGGQYVAFASLATNFFSPDINGATDVFLFNRELAHVSLLSKGPGGYGNAASFSPAISGSGRSIAFASSATNLIPPDDNGAVDIFVKEQDTNVLTRVSVTTSGNPAAGGDSLAPTVSYTGRFVAFESLATNLVGSDSNGQKDVFLRDRDVSANGVFDESGDVATTRISYDFADN